MNLREKNRRELKKFIKWMKEKERKEWGLEEDDDENNLTGEIIENKKSEKDLSLPEISKEKISKPIPDNIKKGKPSEAKITKPLISDTIQKKKKVKKNREAKKVMKKSKQISIFSSFIKKKISERGWKIREFGKKVDIYETYIYELVSSARRSFPTDETINKLASALELTEDERKYILDLIADERKNKKIIYPALEYKKEDLSQRLLETPPERPPWKKFHFEYSENGAALIITCQNIPPFIINAVDSGEIEIALFEAMSIIFILFRIQGFCKWSKVSYAYNLTSRRKEILEDMAKTFTIMLFDHDTKMLKTMRPVSVKDEFFKTLIRYMKMQLKFDFNLDKTNEALNEVLRNFTQGDMINLAGVRCFIPEKKAKKDLQPKTIEEISPVKKEVNEISRLTEKEPEQTVKEEMLLLNNIIISKDFHPPGRKKVQRAIEYYREHGKFDKPVTVDRKYMILTDGYKRYIAARELGLKEIAVHFTEEKTEQFDEIKKQEEKPPEEKEPAKPEARKGETILFPLSEIKIPEQFQKTPPGNKKIRETIEYYNKHGKFDKPVVVKTKTITLTDGYKRYIAAKELGLNDIIVRFT